MGREWSELSVFGVTQIRKLFLFLLLSSLKIELNVYIALLRHCFHESLLLFFFYMKELKVSFIHLQGQSQDDAVKINLSVQELTYLMMFMERWVELKLFHSPVQWKGEAVITPNPQALNPDGEAMPIKTPGAPVKRKAEMQVDSTPPNTAKVRPVEKMIQRHRLPVRTRMWQATVAFEDGKSWTSDWHFTEVHAKKQAEEELNARSDQRRHIIMVNPKYMEAPLKETIMNWICAYELIRIIKGYGSCNGCDHDLKSQDEHLDGCLLNPYSKVELYYDECKALVERELMEHQYRQFLRRLQVPAIHSSFKFTEKMLDDALNKGARDYIDTLLNSEAIFPPVPGYMMQEVSNHGRPVVLFD